jgi:hypothetical protein
VKHNEKTRKDITKKIKTPSKKKECNDIGKLKNWTKKCPSCGNFQSYKRKDVRDKALKINSRCNKCKIFTDAHRKKLGERAAERKYSQDVVQKRLNTLKDRFPGGYNHTEEVKQKISEHMKINNPMFNDEIKSRVKNTLFRKYGGWFAASPVNYNKNACEIFDLINETFGWDGQHAEYKGEKIVDGFYLDYYEPNRNIVIEYDEAHHKRPKVKEKDRIKEKCVRKKLGCEIIRFTDKDTIENILNKLSNYEQ